MRRYTQDERDCLCEIIPNHKLNEICELFEQRTGASITEKQVAAFKKNNHIKSGTQGRFLKGLVPHNKGKSLAEWMSSEGIEHFRATQYKQGNEPVNGRAVPVGAERVDKDGYVEVKVRRMSDKPGTNKCWQLKHRLLWEQAHGPVPDGHIVIFVDGDRRNFNLDNLACISRADAVRMNQFGLNYYDQESLQVALDIVHMNYQIHDRLCNERPCKRCGRIFKPRYVYQRTCDRCLGRANDKYITNANRNCCDSPRSDEK